VAGAVIMNSIIIDYLRLGLHPIYLNGKVANYHWKTFSLKESDIPRYAGYNWGLRAGLMNNGRYLYFLDLDRKDKIADLYMANPMLMEIQVPVVSSGRGFHLYLAWTSEPKTKHYSGIDLICNGYVVAPPSIHPQTKKPYRFIVPIGHEIPLYDPDSIKIIPIETENGHPSIAANSLRSQLVNKRTETSSPSSTLRFAWMDGPPPVPEGMRHNTLVRWLGMLYANKVSLEEAMMLAHEYSAKCKPPMPEEEVNRTVNGCYSLWKNKPT